jgi:hypothetical protein
MREVLKLTIFFCVTEISVHYVLKEGNFWRFWIFIFLQIAIDRKNNSKTKVEKVFSFIFMLSFLKEEIIK